MKKILLFLFQITFILNLNSQQFYIKGKVLDSKKKEPLVSAIVLLTNQNDSKKSGGFTDQNGDFDIKNVLPGRYTIKFSYIGYKSLEKRIQISNVDLNIGTVLLITDSIIMKEITAVGKLPIAEQKNDTVQYIASSYRMNKDANMEDLVQKMPGIIVDQGTVKAQGENIKQVLVDGRQFFGEDPMAALRNLPAEIVDKVQVYDKQSEQAQFTGFDDGQTSKVMNIITRQKMRNAQFGKFTGGYGNEDKYQTSGVLNLFNNYQRFTVIAQSNNINNQNFSIDDILGVMGGGNRGGAGNRFGGQGMRIMRQGSVGTQSGTRPQGTGGGRGSDIGDFMVTQQDGISKVNAVGINYSDSWSDKIQVTGSYFFNLSNNNSEKNLNRTYFQTDNQNQNYLENSTSDSKNLNHRLNIRFEYQIDSSSRLLVQPKMTYQSNNGNSLSDASTLFSNILSNNMNNVFSSNLSAYNFSNDIVYNKRFKSSGRSISISLSTNNTNNLGKNNTNSDNIFYSTSTTIDSVIQNSNLDKTGYRISSNILFTEPLAQNNFLQLSYNISNSINNSDKKTYDDQKEISTLDTSLSNVFKNSYWTHKFGSSYGYQNMDMRLSIGLFYNLSTFDNAQEFPRNMNLGVKFRNFLPTANLRYNFSQRQNLQFFYSSQPNLPTIDQLQNVLDNSNQLQLSIGNSNLKDEIDHNVNLRYSSVSDDLTSTFFFMINSRLSKDYIGKNTIIAVQDTTVLNNIKLFKGTQITQPINLSSSTNLSSFFGYGSSIPFLQSSINFNTMLSYSKIPNSVNDNTYFTSSKSVTFGIVFSSNISENFDYNIGLNYSYNDISSTTNNSGTTNYSNYSARLRLNWTFLDNFVFQTTGNYQYFNGVTINNNPNNLLVNLSIAKKFLSNNQAEIKLTAYDIFNSSNSVQRNSNELYVEDVKTNVLNKYYLLTFSYNLRAFGSDNQ